MYMESKFVHKVSRGSRFNKIYIPREMSGIFEAGTLVEVRLIKPKDSLFYSRVIKLGEFKEKIVKETLLFLSKQKEIKQASVIGSFLTKQIDYNDIDVLIVSEKINDKELYTRLAYKFGMRFHVLVIPEKRFIELSEICPLTRSMLYYSVSNKKIVMPKKRIDKKHVNFLLMMPQDLLEIEAESRTFYDSLRRVFLIERFLENKSEDSLVVEVELKREIPNLFEIIKDNKPISKKDIEKLRAILKAKLANIKNLID